MHFKTFDEMLQHARESGAEFYVEVTEDAMYLRTLPENKLVLRVREEEMAFYNPEEIDIYRITPENEHEDHDTGLVNMLLDKAWGKPGFGDRMKQELDSAMYALMGLEINDSDFGVDGNE